MNPSFFYCGIIGWNSHLKREKDKNQEQRNIFGPIGLDVARKSDESPHMMASGWMSAALIQFFVLTKSDLNQTSEDNLEQKKFRRCYYRCITRLPNLLIDSDLAMYKE